MLGKLMLNEAVLVLLWSAEICRASVAEDFDLSSAVHFQPVCDEDTEVLAAEEYCSGLKGSLLQERQAILDEVSRLDSEKKDIRASYNAFADQKREKDSARHKRIVDARRRRDVEVSGERGAIEALRVKIAEKKDEIRRGLQIKDAGIAKLRDGLRQFASYGEAGMAMLEAEIARVQDSFVVFIDAANGEIQANADGMVEREKRIQCIEREFMQIERMIDDGRDAADLELAERKTRCNASSKTLDNLLRLHGERLATIDDILGQVDARMHDQE